MEQKKLEAIMNLVSNEAIRNELEQAMDHAQVCEVMKRYGVDVTPAELDAICAANTGDARQEMSEDDLELVSGGLTIGRKKCGGGCVALSSFLGLVVGGAVGLATLNPLAGVAAGSAIVVSSQSGFRTWRH